MVSNPFAASSVAAIAKRSKRPAERAVDDELDAFTPSRKTSTENSVECETSLESHLANGEIVNNDDSYSHRAK